MGEGEAGREEHFQEIQPNLFQFHEISDCMLNSARCQLVIHSQALSGTADTHALESVLLSKSIKAGQISGEPCWVVDGVDKDKAILHHETQPASGVRGRDGGGGVKGK